MGELFAGDVEVVEPFEKGSYPEAFVGFIVKHAFDVGRFEKMVAGVEESCLFALRVDAGKS